MFDSICIRKWRQFDTVQLRFHDQLTIIVGANGTGKSSILQIISGRFSSTENPKPFVETPLEANLIKTVWTPSHTDAHKTPVSKNVAIGNLRYKKDGRIRALLTSEKPSRESIVWLHKEEKVSGIHIPSHRVSIVSNALSTVRLTNMHPAELLKRYYTQYQNFVDGKINANSSEHPWIIAKEWLFRLATSASGGEYVSGDPDSKRILDTFCSLIKDIFPESLKFQGLAVRGSDIVIKTENSVFNIDSLSGGLAALFDLCFQLYLCSLKNESFVATIDEPENHLHASMQRKLFPNLLKAFPSAQFIVGTHSPVIINSVKDSTIYVLDWDTKTKVFSNELTNMRKSGTADEILIEVLGLDSALPVWASSQLKEIIEKYSRKQLNTETISAMREDLQRAGLSQYAPTAICNTFENSNDQNR